MATVVLTVNGAKRKVEASPEETLLSVLRNRLDLTGTKYGCGEGQCGACTVLVDGRAARSCQVAASESAGKAIVTIEGLAVNGRLHPVQTAFLEEEAFQCGFCTAGTASPGGSRRETTSPPARTSRPATAPAVCASAASSWRSTAAPS